MGSRSITHLKWPSFKNIHILVEKQDTTGENQVLVLEKLDGSNLGLEICPKNGLLAIHGRNSIIWHNATAEDPFDRRYGSVAESLKPMADLVPRLKKLAQTLSVTTSVVFYGEWYKNQLDTKAVPSWFPFGLAIRNHDNFHQTMTSKLYKAFLEHDLQPPRVLFSDGTVQEAVEALYTMMLDPPNEQFEGVFFTRAVHSGPTRGCAGPNRGCAKWKTRDGRKCTESQYSIIMPTMAYSARRNGDRRASWSAKGLPLPA
jgi:hypothetical protein